MNLPENSEIEISVVVAAWNGATRLRECLLSLENQNAKARAETIAACNFTGGISELEKQFPRFKFLIFPAETIVPQLRAGGVSEAKGAIVALTEDVCFLDSNWLNEIKKPHENGYFAVGGTIGNAGGRKALDWAVYFFDYGEYMPPNRAGAANDLSGMNVSYKKEILERIREKYENGFYETFIHRELQSQGYELFLAPAAVAYHDKTYRFRKIVSQFYHQSRAFAARRSRAFSFPKRLFFTIASMILPVLLFGRIAGRVIAKRRKLKELIISSPFLLILTSVWAFGELCGYLSGAGKSDQEWR